MRIFVAGGTGFIGRALVQRLRADGHEIHLLNRHSKEPIPVVEVVINLAGESVVGLWTSGKRKRILESRLAMVNRLMDAMRLMNPRPKAFISASAVGYYGHRPGEVLSEQSAPDSQKQFRYEVCSQWEKAALAAEELGIRTVLPRFSQVLHPSGGYLQSILPLYRFGLCLGFGRPVDYFPWISREDAIRLIQFAMEQTSLRGAVNAAVPQAMTKKEFSDILAAQFGWKTKGFVPASILRVMMGEFSRALVEDQNIVPQKALANGFQFKDSDLKEYLKNVLKE